MSRFSSDESGVQHNGDRDRPFALQSCWKLAVLIVTGLSMMQPLVGVYAQGKDSPHGVEGECPPGTEQAPRNCEDVRRMAYALAIKKGYADIKGRSGVPDVMERAYKVGFNDCSTGNAHMACMFNDECTAEHGQLLGMRSNSARHATTLYRGANGQEFECDFTPQSSGIFIKNRGDARIGPAFPDPGESMDPAYDCEMNGANYSPYGGGGGLGDMLGGMNLGQLMSLLKQLQDKKSNDENKNSTTPTVIPSPKPTPTPTESPEDEQDATDDTSEVSLSWSESLPSNNEEGDSSGGDVVPGSDLPLWEEERGELVS